MPSPPARSGRLLSGALICFVILSHRQPAQVVRLTRALHDAATDSAVVVHHDAAGGALDPRALDGLDRARLLHYRDGVRWGTYDLVDVTLRCLDWARRNVDAGWFVLLSGQDYPIAPAAEIERFLASTPYDAFVEASRVEPQALVGWPLPEAGWTTRRYYQRHQGVPPELYRAVPEASRRVLAAVGARLTSAQQCLSISPHPRWGLLVGIRRMSTPFTEAHPCYKGAHWFTASRRAVDALLVHATGRLADLYHNTLFPEESFFQTVLLNTPGLRVSRDNMRYIRWATRESQHPDTLRLADVDALVASRKHFARKFDAAVDADALDALDRRLGYGHD